MIFWNTFVRSYEKHLIEENKKYWSKRPNVMEGKDWIYIIHSSRPLIYREIQTIICAKGLQEKEALPLASILCREGYAQKYWDLDTSFGILQKDIIYPWEKSEFFSKIKVSLVAKFLTRTTYKNKEKLFKMSYRGISCGNTIHDMILRLGIYDKPAFDCFDISKKAYYNYIKDALSAIDAAYEIFRKRQPKYLVVVEPICIERLIQAVANKLGGKVLFPFSSNAIISIKPKSNYEVKAMFGSIIKTAIEKTLEHRQLADDSDEDFFLCNVHSQDRAGIKENLKIDNGRMNVFVLSHCIQDAPRENGSIYFYGDYNEWLLDTLQIIKDIPDVNWIIKDHPYSSWYKQDGYFETIRKNNQNENIFWCDKSVSGQEIREIADCVITCTGDPGVEYWAYGIPTLSLAETPYISKGISYNVKSREQYINMLKNIRDIKVPSKESVMEARAYMSAYRQLEKNKNRFDGLFSDISSMWIKVLKEESDDDFYFQILDTFCKRYIDFLHSNQIESSNVYNLKYVYEVE